MHKQMLETKSTVLTIRFDPEDTMLAAGCSDSSIRIFHMHTG